MKHQRNTSLIPRNEIGGERLEQAGRVALRDSSGFALSLGFLAVSLSIGGTLLELQDRSGDRPEVRSQLENSFSKRDRVQTQVSSAKLENFQ